MLFATASAVLLLPFLVVRAIPNPTEPSGTSVFAAGSQCTLQWTADPNGQWQTMNIQLMSGPNSPMVHMRTIGTVNGNEDGNFSWDCPALDLYSKVYFYQFTSPDDKTDGPLWSTRFTISDTDGSTVDPPSTLTDSNGNQVGYGTGTFQDKSLYNAMPDYLVGNGQIDGGTGNAPTQDTTASGSVSGAPTPVPSSTGPPSSTFNTAGNPDQTSSTASIKTLPTNTKKTSPDGAVAVIGGVSVTALLAAVGAAAFGTFAAL